VLLTSIGSKINIVVTSILVISLTIGFFVLFYFKDKTKIKTYNTIVNELQENAKEKLKSKKDIGITNAISIANDARIKKSLKTNNRNLAITSLSNVSTNFKQNTNFKNIKVHIHTKENYSFLRNWKPKKFGDDLSGFRASVVQVNLLKKPIVTFEVGKIGLSLRAVTPVIGDDGIHLGSLEFMQGLNSVAKAFKKNKSVFLLLMDESLKKAPIPLDKKFKNFAISQKFIDKDFLKDIQKINIQKIYSNNYILSDNYFITYIKIKDFKNKELGIALLGKPLNIVDFALDDASRLITISLAILIMMGFVMMVTFSLLNKRLVLNPLIKFEKGLLEFFKYLNKESNTVSHLDDSSADEIGFLAKVVNQNISKSKALLEEDKKVINETITVLAEFEKGDLCQRVNITTSNPLLQELTKLLNKMGENIELNINNILKILDEYSNGIYINKVKTIDLKEDLLKLAKGVNILGDSVTVMLVKSKKNGLTLDDGSDVLLEIIDVLHSNTDANAIALEETSKILQELTASITSNTKNVVEMSKYANILTSSADEGQSLAKQTTISMSEINEEVNSVNKAIAIIDKIAFKTNILSLNAAVEAATAGENGKGFAVVAQEVRELATQSGEAANEIKALIENAAKKASDGKEIADKMISGYSELNENISKTIEIIIDTKKSSKEQQKRIEQINNSVASIDKQTHKIASMAKQTHIIADETDSIAKLVVINANKKDFSGKNDVQAMSKDEIQQVHEEVKDLKSVKK
jgi:methyl-accepting chemotaxis protein